MVVGEIGIDRDLYMYRLQYWEILLIIWGYFRRSHPMYDAARLVAHQVHYCMGVPKGTSAKLPHELIPFSWEKKQGRPISLEEEQELLAEMDAINQALDKGAQETPTMVNQQTDQGEPTNSPRSNV